MYLENVKKDKYLRVEEKDFDKWCDVVIAKYKNLSKELEEYL